MFLFYSVWDPWPWMVLTKFRVEFSSSVHPVWKPPTVHFRCISYEILNPVQLMMKVNCHSYTVSSKPAWDTVWDPVSGKKKMSSELHDPPLILWVWEEAWVFWNNICGEGWTFKEFLRENKGITCCQSWVLMLADFFLPGGIASDGRFRKQFTQQKSLDGYLKIL